MKFVSLTLFFCILSLTVIAQEPARKLAIDAIPTNRLLWDSRPVEFSDFKAKNGEKQSGYLRPLFMLLYNVPPGGSIMVENSMVTDSSWAYATSQNDSLGVLILTQLQFDIWEIEARKFRKYLVENNSRLESIAKTGSTYRLKQELDKVNMQHVTESMRRSQSMFNEVVTDAEAFFKKWRQGIDQELTELDDYKGGQGADK